MLRIAFSAAGFDTMEARTGGEALLFDLPSATQADLRPKRAAEGIAPGASFTGPTPLPLREGSDSLFLAPTEHIPYRHLTRADRS
jgi:hypothetical protein